MSQQKPEQGHDEQGRFTTVYHDEDIIDILGDAGPAGTGTRDVADTLGCSLVHATRLLNALEAEGQVSSRKIGGNHVWTLSDAEREQETSPRRTSNHVAGSTCTEVRTNEHTNDANNHADERH